MLTERDEFIYDEMICPCAYGRPSGGSGCACHRRGDGGVKDAIHRFSGSIWWKWIIRLLLRPAVYTFRKMPANWTMAGYISILIMLCALFGGAKSAYDLIIVDSMDPFWSVGGAILPGIYGICYNALHDDGILVNQQGSPFYKHDADEIQRSHKRIVSHFRSAVSIRLIFRPMPPDTGFWLCE